VQRETSETRFAECAAAALATFCLFSSARFICTGGTAHNNREQEVRARESSAASSTRNQFHPVRTHALRKFAYKFPCEMKMHMPAAAAAASGLLGFVTAMFCLQTFHHNSIYLTKRNRIVSDFMG
jgi:hypothetical protein